MAILSSKDREDIESWIVNSVKLKMILKMDHILEQDGKINLRKLFLVPIFKISELQKRVAEHAPELRTFFYKELMVVIEKAEKRLIS